jgi:hypothetical protein
MHSGSARVLWSLLIIHRGTVGPVLLVAGVHESVDALGWSRTSLVAATRVRLGYSQPVAAAMISANTGRMTLAGPNGGVR